METIKASVFKTKCLQLMDEVARSGEEIVVTKNGKPVSRLVAYRKRPQTLFGLMAGAMEIVDDILQPIDTQWESEG